MRSSPKPPEKTRANRIRTSAGDRALVEMTPYDLTEGRITFRVR